MSTSTPEDFTSEDYTIEDFIEVTWYTCACLGIIIAVLSNTGQPTAARLMSYPGVNQLKYSFGELGFDFQEVVVIALHQNCCNKYTHIVTYFIESTVWLLLIYRLHVILLVVFGCLQVVQLLSYFIPTCTPGSWRVGSVYGLFFLMQVAGIVVLEELVGDDIDNVYLYPFILIGATMRSLAHIFEPLPPGINTTENFDITKGVISWDCCCACCCPECCGEEWQCIGCVMVRQSGPFVGTARTLLIMFFGIVNEYCVNVPLRLPIPLFYYLFGPCLDAPRYKRLSDDAHSILNDAKGNFAVGWFGSIMFPTLWYKRDMPMPPARAVFVVEIMYYVGALIYWNVQSDDSSEKLCVSSTPIVDAWIWKLSSLVIGTCFVQYMVILSNHLNGEPPAKQIGALGLRFIEEGLLCADVGLLFVSIAPTGVDWSEIHDDSDTDSSIAPRLDALLLFAWIFMFIRVWYLVYKDPLVNQKVLTLDVARRWAQSDQLPDNITRFDRMPQTSAFVAAQRYTGCCEGAAPCEFCCSESPEQKAVELQAAGQDAESRTHEEEKTEE